MRKKNEPKNIENPSEVMQAQIMQAHTEWNLGIYADCQTTGNGMWR